MARRRSIAAPPLLSPELAKAMSHATRVHAMCVLNERQACPKEIAEELDEVTKNVAYHFKVLRDLDCIELVSTKPARGGRVTEHFYRAKKRPYFDDAAWEQLVDNEKWAVVIPIMRLISKDVNESLAGGTFMDPDDNHVSRTPMVVDMQGWIESKELLDEAANGLMEIQTGVTERCKDGDSKTMVIKVEIIQFRSPDEKAA